MLISENRFFFVFIALNWSNEFNFWLKNIEPLINHYQLATVEPNSRVEYLNNWHKNGGVLIMGYEMYRRLATGIGIENEKMKTDAHICLVNPGPDVVGNVNFVVLKVFHLSFHI